MGRSKLRAALAAEKGVDFIQLKQAKKHKQKQKQKKAAAQGQEGGVSVLSEDSQDEWEDEDDDGESDGEGDDVSPFIDGMASESETDEDEDGDEAGSLVDIDALDESESGSDVDMEEKIDRRKKQTPSATTAARKAQAGNAKGEVADDADEGEDEDEEDEDVAWSDLEDLDPEEKEDLVLHQRQTVNNKAALLASLQRIRMPTDSSVAFVTHQSVVGTEPTADKIPDISDDLTRELQFYSQALDAARKARALLLKEKVPFSRPIDYFAEMVKDDGHMEKVKARLVEQASTKKAAAEARKQRDLKKFGKQVQVAKLQERQKAKKDTLDKIKTLKRKRNESTNDATTHEADDLFDVAVDKEIKSYSNSNSNSKGSSNSKNKSNSSRKASNGTGQPNPKRQKKNEKFGFGGKKRHAKSGDAISSGDLSGFSGRKMKGGGGPPSKGKAPRPGKARRKSAATRM